MLKWKINIFCCVKKSLSDLVLAISFSEKASSLPASHLKSILSVLRLKSINLSRIKTGSPGQIADHLKDGSSISGQHKVERTSMIALNYPKDFWYYPKLLLVAIRAGTKHRAPHRAYRNINSRLNSSVPCRAEPGVTNGPRSSVRRAAAGQNAMRCDVNSCNYCWYV